MDGQTEGQTLEEAKDLGNDDKATVKRWLLELKLSDKREKEWRTKAEKVWNTYRSKAGKANSFNILWANTETLRPAVYNSTPKPDVRKRYKDGDPIGKKVAEVLGRSLEYTVDAYDFDANINNCVLDMLLPGRGVARVRYVPTLSGEGDEESLTWEAVTCEQVQWDDYRQGEGKTWDEVQWVGFRHRLTRAELKERFGEVGEKIPLDSCQDEELESREAEQVAELFKTALVWEIWDKGRKKVLFIAPAYKEAPAQELDDPLELIGFYPIPRPLYAVEDSASMVPTALYDLYREQAMELDRVSGRINVIIKGLKLRGIYDSTLTEMSELMRGDDNDLIPAQHVSALIERGGLEKAIWMLPIKDAAAVLRELYIQRDQTKNVIYEITGISDILRGSTSASETATAQQIKSQWGSIRLKRMQNEVQRFIRDLMRLKGEVIAAKFQMETLEAMTLVKLPHDAEVQMQQQQMMMQYQMATQQAQMQGQQPPPPPQMPPPPVTWEKVMEVLRSDMERSYRVDVETDSTIASSVESDMTALNEVLGGLGAVFNTMIPVVQTGAISIESVKEIALAVVRRARLGNAVEDALDDMKPPQAPPQEQDNSAQIEQMRQQADQQKFQAEKQFQGQMEQAKMQQTMQLEQMRTQSENEREAMRMQQAQQSEAMQLQHQQQLEVLKADAEAQRLEFDRWKAQLDAETKVLVAQIGAASKAQSESNVEEPQEQEPENDALAMAMQGFTAALQQMRAPRTATLSDGRQIKVE